MRLASRVLPEARSTQGICAAGFSHFQITRVCRGFRSIVQRGVNHADAAALPLGFQGDSSFTVRPDRMKPIAKMFSESVESY